MEQRVDYQTANGPISVNVADFPRLMDMVSDKIKSDQGFALATLNLDHLVKMNDDASFYEAYKAQDLVVADGNPIVWLSRLTKRPMALVPGSELIEPLCKRAAELQAPVALLGSTPETLAEAARELKKIAPGLEIVAEISPTFGFDPTGEEAKDAIVKVHTSGARLCFLALGAPKQEVLAAFAKDHAPHTGFVSIGAGLDFIAGSQTRAPLWVRKIAMEWVWRLMSNPKRMTARYLKCIAIMPGHTLRALKVRFS